MGNTNATDPGQRYVNANYDTHLVLLMFCQFELQIVVTSNDGSFPFVVKFSGGIIVFTSLVAGIPEKILSKRRNTVS